MKTSFFSKALKLSEVKLTPHELVIRHMSDQRHTITDEEWNQLQVGVEEERKMKKLSRANSFINSYGIKEN